MPILIAIGGLSLLILLILQILIGFRKLKIDFKYHKTIAIILLVLALGHGAAGVFYLFG